MGKQKPHRERGSRKGQISWFERGLTFLGRKLWFLASGAIGGIAWGIGDAAQYVKDNWLSIHSSMPWYAAAGVLLIVGIILAGRDAKKIKETDTREVIPPKEVK